MSSINRVMEFEFGVMIGIFMKGFSVGMVGLIGVVVIGILCIVLVYIFMVVVGFIVFEVGVQIFVIIFVGFILMLLVVFGYCEFNNWMFDFGMLFIWVVWVFGFWVGWMVGWGFIVVMIFVLLNFVGVVVDFLFLLFLQIMGNVEVVMFVSNIWINIGVCLFFMFVVMWVFYCDMQMIQKLQYWFVSFQIFVLVFFVVVVIVQVVNGNGFDYQLFDLNWFNLFVILLFSVVVVGFLFLIFIFWGWDVMLIMNEEIKDLEKMFGCVVMVIVFMIVLFYLLFVVVMIMFVGVGMGVFGFGNEDIQENVFFYFFGFIFGLLVFFVLFVVFISLVLLLQLIFVGLVCMLFVMGYYGVLLKFFVKVSFWFFIFGYVIIVLVIVVFVFYVVMCVVSEDILWDIIFILGMMICFYYGIIVFVCVWYFCKQWFDLMWNFFFMFLFLFVGGVIFVVLFFIMLIDFMDFVYGFGLQIGGVGIVFIFGMFIIVVGIVVMIWNVVCWFVFFCGEMLGIDVLFSC